MEEKIGFKLPESKISVRIAKLRDDAVIPQYAHRDKSGRPMDMCMDLTAVSMDYDIDNDVYIYHTGLQIETPQGTGAFLVPRSSNRRTNAYLCNSPGVCDYGYAGDYTVCYKNRTPVSQIIFNDRVKLLLSLMADSLSYDDFRRSLPEEEYKGADEVIEMAMRYAPYKVGERIAQMVIVRYDTIEWNIVDSIPDLRKGGFGSTGL